MLYDSCRHRHGIVIANAYDKSHQATFGFNTYERVDEQDLLDFLEEYVIDNCNATPKDFQWSHDDWILIDGHNFPKLDELADFDDVMRVIDEMIEYDYDIIEAAFYLDRYQYDLSKYVGMYDCGQLEDYILERIRLENEDYIDKMKNAPEYNLFNYIDHDLLIDYWKNCKFKLYYNTYTFMYYVFEV